jgi:dihydrofolate reductase
MNSIPFDLVVARSLNYGIGLGGKLPWNLPPDLKMFRKITCSGPHRNSIIMGRKTYESIGKALPNRLNIIISKNSKIT